MFENLSSDITAVERQTTAGLLLAAGVNPVSADITMLAGDGSERRFLRVAAAERALIVVLPARSSVNGAAESRSTWFIGRHLRSHAVPVPEMYGYDPETGIVICEDLGDRLLHHEVVARQWSDEKLVTFYEPVIELLVHMQIVGARSFQAEWCWDTKRYDRQLMLTRESGYFMESCCRHLLGVTSVPKGLQKEFIRLADQASVLPAGFFLHRDFQSRNIMVKDGCLRVIDFQGGRFGPLGYDLASLLIDPYVSLPDHTRERLLQKYIDWLADYSEGGANFSVEGYFLLALQRNLQILGAFAFLATVKGKVFFRDYLAPAATGLQKILREPGGQQFPVLRAFTDDLPEMLNNVMS